MYTYFDYVYVYRMIERQEKQKELLDGCTNAIDYIVKRLNWDEETKRSALKSCPALLKCNMFKVFTFRRHFFFYSIKIHDPFNFRFETSWTFY